MKYLEHLLLIPGCIYRSGDKSYNNFVDAVNNSIESETFKGIVIIEIENPNTDGIQPSDIRCTNFESKDILCRHAKFRYIYISLDKSEIYFESFELKNSSDNWICNFEYDYEFMYGNDHYAIEFDAYSNIYKMKFRVELYPISTGKGFTSTLTKEEALNSLYKYSGVSLRYICYDEEDDDYFIPLSDLSVL